LSPGSNRRHFLKTIMGGTAALSISARYRAFGQGASTAPLAATKIADNFVQISGAGANVVVLSTPEGLLMVNCGLPERSADVMKTVSEQFPGAPVRILFNTDWHLENTGSNETISKTGAKIVAHENTKLWMGAEIISQWQKRTYKPRPKEAFPSQTFYTTGKMDFGKQEVRYGYLGQSHTDGDIYVFFPGLNILVAGDVFSVGSYPILDYTTGGWIGGLSDGTRTLVGLTDAQTRVIPGNGRIQNRDALQAQAEMTSTMRTRFVEMMRKGMSARDMFAAAPTKEFDAKWGDPELFIFNAYPGLWNHVREIGGIV
jgi:cyclase